MNKSIWSKRLLRYVGILLIITLALSLLWDSTNGWGGSEIFTGLGLVLVIGAMLYLKQMQNVSEQNITQRIRAEFPSESQPQVFEIYRHLKLKELEGLFLKILDDSNGDVKKVEKLASVAESVGWQAFIENHW